MKGNIPVRQGDLNLVVQQIAFGTLVYLKRRIDYQSGMYFRKFHNFVVNFIMEQFLISALIFSIGLRFYQVSMPLLVILLVFTVGTYV